MINNRVKYKESIKKQIWFGIFFIVGVCIIGYALSPAGNFNKILMFAFMSVMLAGLTISLVRNAAKEASCPHCQQEIFEIIQASEQIKMEIKYCPSCGNKIEI